MVTARRGQSIRLERPNLNITAQSLKPKPGHTGTAQTVVGARRDRSMRGRPPSHALSPEIHRGTRSQSNMRAQSGKRGGLCSHIRLFCIITRRQPSGALSREIIQVHNVHSFETGFRLSSLGCMV